MEVCDRHPRGIVEGHDSLHEDVMIGVVRASTSRPPGT